MTSTPDHENPAPREVAPPAARLEIAGAVRGTHATPGLVRLDRAALARLAPAAQVPDVGALMRGKVGRGVRLHALAEAAGADRRASHVTVYSTDPRFVVSVPLAEILANAVLVYELDGEALPDAKGGPFRLLACGHPDECVHVKSVARIEFTHAPGRDTRPKDDAEHRALHERARAKSAPTTTRSELATSAAHPTHAKNPAHAHGG